MSLDEFVCRADVGKPPTQISRLLQKMVHDKELTAYLAVIEKQEVTQDKNYIYTKTAKYPVLEQQQAIITSARMLVYDPHAQSYYSLEFSMKDTVHLFRIKQFTVDCLKNASQVPNSNNFTLSNDAIDGSCTVFCLNAYDLKKHGRIHPDSITICGIQGIENDTLFKRIWKYTTGSENTSPSKLTCAVRPFPHYI